MKVDKDSEATRGDMRLKFIEFFDGQPGLTDQFSEQAKTKFIMPSHLTSPRRGEGWGEGGGTYFLPNVNGLFFD